MNIKDKTIILFSDSPHATSGRGRLSRYMIRMLRKMEPAKIILVGHHHDWFKYNQLTNKFQPLMKEEWSDIPLMDTRMFGLEHSQEAQLLLHALKVSEVDLVITMCDWAVLRSISNELMKLKAAKGFKWINYCTHDYNGISTQDASDAYLPDKMVMTSKFGMDTYLDVDPAISNISYIWHPIEASEFPEVPAKDLVEFKKAIFTLTDTNTKQQVYVAKGAKPIIGWVGRNFWRKQPSRAMDIFKEFVAKRERAIMYMHTNPVGHGGLDLREYAVIQGLFKGEVVFPAIIEEVAGFTDAAINQMYKTIDIYLSTSLGEGFGFPTVEAMLNGVPVVAPSNTSFDELVQDFGVLVPCTDTYTADQKGQIPRPLIDKKLAIEALLEVSKNLPAYKAKAQKGRQWVIDNLNLDVIGKQWGKLISEIS